MSDISAQVARDLAHELTLAEEEIAALNVKLERYEGMMCDYNATFHQQAGEIAALKKENAQYVAACRQFEQTVERLETELARAREALEKLARLGNGDSYGNSTGNQIAIDALREAGYLKEQG